jgi:hypothetical protein
MEAVRTSETSVDNHFTRQYNPEDSSEHHTRRRENLKSHINSILPRMHGLSHLNEHRNVIFQPISQSPDKIPWATSVLSSFFQALMLLT